MKSQGLSPALFVRGGEELPLSGPALLELLRAVLDKGKPFRFRANGSSMSPFIHNGDIITVSPLAGILPRPGDIVAFIHPLNNKLIVHRVVSRNSITWLVQGDNAPEPDGLFPTANLLGRVTRIERRGRRIFFGLGLERFLIAWLARHGWLLLAKSVFLSPRRVASVVLRGMQGSRPYRTICRSMRRSFVITEASSKDISTAYVYLNAKMPPPPAEPGHNDYVAKCGAKVVGFVQFVHNPSIDTPWSGHWLFSLVVWPQYRCFGIGEALTLRVIEQARALAAPELLLALYEDNANAINLYRKLGFEQITVPALEPQLEAEKSQCGRRRVIMRKEI